MSQCETTFKMLYLGEWRLNCQRLQLEELADKVLLCKAQGFQFTEDLLEYLQKEQRTSAKLTSTRNRQPHLLEQLIEFWLHRSVTLSNLVLSATSRSEADMLPMSSSEDDCERRLLDPCTVSLFRLEVEPVSFPELPWRPAVTRHT